MMLHHPFKNPTLTDLMRDPSGLVFDTWQEAYRYCQERHSDHESDPLDMDNPMIILDDEPDTESLDKKDKNLNAGDVQFEELLNQRHPRRDGVVASNNTEFSQRDNDKNCDWLAAKSYPVDIHSLINHLETQKGATTKAAAPATLEEAGDVEMLNPKQRQVFDRVMDHYLSRDTSQLLFHVDGVAGTGKSTCIDIISQHMAYHAAQSAGPTEFHDPIIWAAPTGVAAYNIQGCTVHSLLRLPINQAFVDLRTGTLSKLQRQFHHFKLLIIDEKSMVGFNFLYRIDLRLRSIFARPDQYFGGMNILLGGDFAQLSPVGDSALYSKINKQSSVIKLVAKKGYDAFTDTIVLTESMR